MTQVGSRYLLDYVIGQGAWGRVWHGRRRSDDAPVAIKVLRAEYATDPEVVSRLLRERTLLQALRHPNLVEVEDLVVEGETLAIVMELIDGVDLGRLTEHGALDIDEVPAMLTQVAQALAYIHARGVLHRDIKPENILVSREGGRIWARLTDFGLASVGDGQRLTRASHVVGTPAYLAPELLAGHAYGTAVDIYAFGVTAYELLSGQRPFSDQHPVALMRAHLDDQPTRPPGMTEDHWRIVHACLAKDPRQRPTAAQLVEQLGQLDRDSAPSLAVDFGTCTTTGVLCWPDRPAQALYFDGSALLPSAVYAEADGTILTGEAALAAGSTQPQRCEPYPRLRTANSSVPMGDLEVDAVDLVAAVLRRVAELAVRTAGSTLAQTVITHPASWGTPDLTLLLRAARKAGLPNPQLVATPVAAAAELVGPPGTGLPADTYAVLYDLGAATTTVSVVRRTADGGFDMVATEELSDNGSIDIDAAILEYLGEIFAPVAPEYWHRLSQPADLSDQRASWQLLRDVQRVKEVLSRSATTSLHIPLIDQHVSLDRQELDRLARPVLERATNAIHTALALAGVAATDLTAIYPIGGASQMPLVTAVLRQALGLSPTVVEQPQLVVAQGASRLTRQGAPAQLPANPGGDRPNADVARNRILSTGTGLSTSTGLSTGTGAHRRRAPGSRDGRGGRMPVWTRLWPQNKLAAVATVLVLATTATVVYKSLPAHSSNGQAAPACGYKIAYLSSSVRFLAQPTRDSTALAVQQYNAKHPGCTVELVAPRLGDQAAGDVVDQTAEQVAADPKVLGVVSPLSPSETQVAMPILDGAGVATISPTLTQPTYAQSGSATFHRTVGTDLDDVTAGIRQLTRELRARKVFVVDDGSPDSTEGAANARRQLGAGTLAGAASMGQTTDHSVLVKEIAGSKADAVYYTGFPHQFGSFVNFVAQLRHARPRITIFGWQWAYDDHFVAAAGQQPPDNIHVTCTCRPPDRNEPGFNEQFTGRYRRAPTWYAAEAFDAANILLSGLDAGMNTRSTMLDWVNHYDGDGVSGHIKFSSTGDLVAPTTWMLRYDQGALVIEAPIP